MLSVVVSADHIRLGVRRCPCKCPIALAIRDHLGSEYRVYVSPHTILVEGPRRNYVLWVTPVMQRFIQAFDNGMSVVPHVFQILQGEEMNNSPQGLD